MSPKKEVSVYCQIPQGGKNHTQMRTPALGNLFHFSKTSTQCPLLSLSKLPPDLADNADLIPESTLILHLSPKSSKSLTTTPSMIGQLSCSKQLMIKLILGLSTHDPQSSTLFHHNMLLSISHQVLSVLHFPFLFISANYTPE